MSFFLTLLCALLRILTLSLIKEILIIYIQREKRYMNVAAGERAKKTKTKSEKNDHHCFRRRLYRHHPLLEYARGRKKRLGEVFGNQCLYSEIFCIGNK